MSKTLLSIKNLSIGFSEKNRINTVVQNISFDLQKGRTLSLVGESGSGKSVTTLSTVSLLPSNAIIKGSILFNGKEMIGSNENYLRNIRGNKISFIFQEPMTSLNPLHNIEKQIGESLDFHQNLKGEVKLNKTIELLNKVGINNPISRLKDFPHQLSGGQKQRIMIAIALANKPDLLIADEPTTALDVTIENKILKLLMDLKKTEDMSIIFITHNLKIVRKISDDICVMKNGKIVEKGYTKDVFVNPQESYTKKLLQAEPKGKGNKLIAKASEILKVENINVWFPIKRGILRRNIGYIKAVNNVYFSMVEGETIGIVGESGSGKTSLAMAILRLIPCEGKIIFNGKNIKNIKTRELLNFRKNMQIVFQDPFGSLSPRMTVEQIIGEGIEIHNTIEKSKRKDLILSLIDEVGLKPEMLKRYPHEFSGGQRQRIAIARAMILKPKLLILDEPTSALDMTVQQQIIDLLKSLQKKFKLAYIFVSHDISLIRSVSNNILVMHNGHIVEQNNPSKLFSSPQNKYTRELISSINFL